MGKQTKPKKAPNAYRRAKALGKIQKDDVKVKATSKQRSAAVTLTIGSGQFSGKSSGQYGHAEMDALRKFLRTCDDFADAWRQLNRTAKKTVVCPNQPICGSCTLILRDVLGFTARNFSDEKSGGVAWGCSMKVREFLFAGGKGADLDQAMARGKK